MIKKGKICVPWILIFIVVMVAGGNLFVFPSVQTDEELKAKFGPILGDYEIDLSDIGGEATVLSFYVENGKLWADSGDGRPAGLTPIEDLEFAFRGEDPQEGRFEFYFLKDEEGNYSKCRVVVEALGMEFLAFKIRG